MASNRIYIQLDFQTSAASANVKKFNQEVSGIGISIKQSFAGLNAAIASLAIPAGIQKIAEFGYSFIEASSNMQRAQIVLESVTGSMSEAVRVLEQVKQLSREQPFAFSELQETVVRLSAFGFTANQAVVWTEAIADAASRVGGTVEKLNQIALAIGQIKVKGRLNAEELNRQLGEAGVTAVKYVAEALEQERGRATTVSEVLKLAEKGQLNAEAGLRAILAGMRRDSAGLGKALTSQLPTAQLQKLRDEITFVAAAIGDILVPAFRAMLEPLSAVLKGTQELTKEFKALQEAAIVTYKLPTAQPEEFRRGPGPPPPRTAAAYEYGASQHAAEQSIQAFKVIDKALADIFRDPEGTGRGIARFLGLQYQRQIDEESNRLQQLRKQHSIDAIHNLETTLATMTKRTVAELEEQRRALGPLELMDPQQLVQMRDELRRQYAVILDDRKNANQKLEQENKEAIEHANEIARQAVEAAMVKAGRLDPLAPLLRQTKISAEATQDVWKAMAINFEVLMDELADIGYAAALKRAQNLGDLFLPDIGQIIKVYETQRKYIEQTRDLEREVNRSRIEHGITQIDQARDLAALRLQAVAQDTLESRQYVAQQTAQLQIEALQKTRDIRIQLDQEVFDHEVSLLRDIMEMAIQAGQERTAAEADRIGRVAVLWRQFEEQRRQTTMNTDAEIAKARMDSMIQLRQMQIDENRKVYEGLKDSAGRVFDALVQKSTSVWSAIANIFKSTVLTAIREVVTSNVAAGLSGLFGGGPVSFTGNVRERLMGLKPMFAGGGGNIMAPLVPVVTDLSVSTKDLTIATKELAVATRDMAGATVKAQDSAHRMVDDQDEVLSRMERDAAGLKPLSTREKALMQTPEYQEFRAEQAAFQREMGSLVGEAKTAAPLRVDLMNSVLEELKRREPAAKLQTFSKETVDYLVKQLTHTEQSRFGRGKPVQNIQIINNVIERLEAAEQLYELPYTAFRGHPLPFDIQTQANILSRMRGNPRMDMLRSELFTERLYNLPQERYRVTPTLPSGADIYNLPISRPPGYATTMGMQMPIGKISTLSQLKDSFNIGKPITVGGRTIPWAQASPRAKLGAIFSSGGFQALAQTIGFSAAMAGLQRSGVLGDAMTIGGGALAGYGIASSIGLSGAGGAVLGAGAGLFAAGVKRGGVAGVAMTTAGGIMAGAMIGGAIGGPPGLIVGAIVGGAIGLGTGIARLFYKTADEKLRQKILQVYGVDIPDQRIRAQMLEIAKQQYGGNLDVAVRSAEIQELVRLYSVATGANARLPRPMYGASLAQSGAGLQLQPVYSEGRLVPNPYTGTTTTQLLQGGTQWIRQGIYLQLNPQQANELFEGRVVNVMQNNPGTVAQANASAARSGSSRDANRGALLEPLTVMR